MAEIQNKDIVELKNSSGFIVFPKTTGEAVYLADGRDVEAFLKALHEALEFNIVPKTSETVSLGTSEKKFKELRVKKIYVVELDASGGSLSNVGTINANTIVANSINGNVNAPGTDDKKVYGAVAQ